MKSTPLTFAAFALVAASAATLSPRSYADAQPGRYVFKSGTVFDTKTKLTWQQESSTTPFTWDDANKYCGGLKIGGMDWRLPSLKELATIIDETRVTPCIDRVTFPNPPAKFFWTASKVSSFPENIWAVDFY